MSTCRGLHLALFVAAGSLAACAAPDRSEPFRVVETADGLHGRIEVLNSRSRF